VNTTLQPTPSTPDAETRMLEATEERIARICGRANARTATDQALGKLPTPPMRDGGDCIAGLDAVLGRMQRLVARNAESLEASN